MCALKMIRRSLGPHLKYCPASVVLCNMRWTREIVAKNCDARDMSQSLRWETVLNLMSLEFKMHSYISCYLNGRLDQLDVAMALKDQITLNEIEVSEIRCIEVSKILH